jgi:hypothetical protein
VLQYDIKNSFKAAGVQVCDAGVETIFKNAQRLYRAFGRLMIHAIANEACIAMESPSWDLSGM